MNGKEAKYIGNPVPYRAKLDQKTRQRLCIIPEYKKKRFGDPVLINYDSIYSAGDARNIDRNMRQYGTAAWTQFRTIFEDFEKRVQRYEDKYQKNLPDTLKQMDEIKAEIKAAQEIRDDLYSLNVIPSKYRNLGCMYFIHEYFSTSVTPLNTVFLHLDLDKIQSQLNTVIKNQEKTILQQSIMISQNEEIISQNTQMFHELSNMNQNLGSMNSKLQSIDASLGSIYESSIETAQWAQIGALNARTCAWISCANYLENSAKA